MNSLNANTAATSGDALPWLGGGLTETLFLWIRLSCEVWPEDLPELPKAPWNRSRQAKSEVL